MTSLDLSWSARVATDPSRDDDRRGPDRWHCLGKLKPHRLPTPPAPSCESGNKPPEGPQDATCTVKMSNLVPERKIGGYATDSSRVAAGRPHVNPTPPKQDVDVTSADDTNGCITPYQASGSATRATDNGPQLQPVIGPKPPRVHHFRPTLSPFAAVEYSTPSQDLIAADAADTDGSPLTVHVDLTAAAAVAPAPSPVPVPAGNRKRLLRVVGGLGLGLGLGLAICFGLRFSCGKGARARAMRAGR